MLLHSVFQRVSNTSAVAEDSAVAELPAVAGVSSQRQPVVTKEEIRRAGTQPFKMNNTALKSIRDCSEMPFGCPSVWGRRLVPAQRISNYDSAAFKRGGLQFDFAYDSMVMEEYAELG